MSTATQYNEPQGGSAAAAAAGAGQARLGRGGSSGRGELLQRQEQERLEAGAGARARDSPADTLEAIFGLQRGFAKHVDGSRYPSGRPERIAALCTAIIQEAAELQATTNWKWWKRQTKFDEANAREELIDIWHFVVQASLELGLSPSDVLDEYRRKNRINVERQENGY